MNIIKKICSNWGERNGYIPDTIVVHISAGSLTSMTDWFSKPTSQASSHYGVGKDGVTIYQYVEESKKAWTNGNVKNPSASVVLERPGVNPNLYTLTIENEGLDLQKAPEVQLVALCELIKDIAKRWNIPLDRKHILGHYEIDSVNRPYCPSPSRTLMDQLVVRLNTVTPVTPGDEMVKIPRKLLQELLKYI